MAGTWSSAARLQALNPHSTFAVSPDIPKARNPLLAADANATHVHMPQAMDFSRTIPLSELMHADVASPSGGGGKRRTQAVGGALTRTMVGTMTNFGATTHNFTSTAGLPLRVPDGDTYSHSLSTVHAARADRLIRQPKGWSQGEANRRKQLRQEEKEERIHIYQPAAHEDLMQSKLQSRAGSAPTGAVPSHRLQHHHHPRPAFIPSDASGSALVGSLGPNAERAITAALDPETRARERAELAQKKLADFWSDVNAEKERVAVKLRERIARNQAKEEARFERMVARLGENKELLREITEYLSLHTAESDAKKEQLYRAWCAQIFGPISDAIASGLAQRSTSEIERRRRREFANFLNMTNVKPSGLSNDAIFEASRQSQQQQQQHKKKPTTVTTRGAPDAVAANEYDPLAGRAHHLKISTGHLRDPLKHASEQAEAEWRILQSLHPPGSVERIHHQVKTTLPLDQWAKIEATPHGRYSLLKGNVQAPVGKRLVAPSASYSSEFTTASSLDHYQIDTDMEVVRKQFWSHGGKRVAGYSAQADQGRDYNILVANEPSLKATYAHHTTTAAAGAAPFSPTTHAATFLPPIAASPPRTAAAPRSFIESKMDDDQ